MKKRMKIFGVIVLYALMISIIVSVYLVNPSKVEFEGDLDVPHHSLELVEIGELQKGDKVKIVITDLRGTSGCVIHFDCHLGLRSTGLMVEFSFLGEKNLQPQKMGYIT
jgi:hypothetical protein